MRPFPKRLRRKSARHWRAAPETGHSVLSNHRRPSSRRPLLRFSPISPARREASASPLERIPSLTSWLDALPGRG